ncbi:MAG: DHH family phosphoesterase [Nanoarchaeota archaeon]|nr:DHH family phosphoesterase [Nanoarchaeota archaeon]
MKSLKDVLKNCEKAVILYHIDTDGICAAKIVSEALNRLNKEVINFFPTTPKLLESVDFQIGIKRNKPDLIIFVDVELKASNKLLKDNPDTIFLVFDHHNIDELPKGSNVLYFNPKIGNDYKFTPAAKIVFDEMNKVVDINDLDWVCAVGIIGDSGAPHHKSFVKNVMKKYNIKEEKDNNYFFDSFFGTLSNIINSGKIVKGNDGAQMALKILQESANPEEFHDKSYKLRDWSNKIEDYLKEVENNFEARKEAYEGLELFFYTFKPEYMIGSVLSTIVSFKHAHNTVIIFSKKNGITTINLRRQDKKYNMSELAKKAIKGLKKAGGGGHDVAAGGHVQTKDLNMFKRNIIIELKKMMKQ